MTPEGIASASRSSTSALLAPLYYCVRNACLFLSPRCGCTTNSHGHFPYGLVRAGVPFVLLAHLPQGAAAASRDSEYGCGVGAAAGSWNRLFDRGQNSEDAQIVWRLQELGRLAYGSRHRAETHGKNAQVHHRRQERCAEEAGGQRGDVIQIPATRGAEKLESRSSYVELKPNKFNKKNRLEDRPLQD
jgi:hypothetical protein